MYLSNMITETKTNETMETLKFEAGKKYEMSFIGDSDLKVVFECISRTAKTAKFKNKHESFSKKIKVYDNEEYVMYGSYSMAPAIHSKKILN